MLQDNELLLSLISTDAVTRKSDDGNGKYYTLYPTASYYHVLVIWRLRIIIEPNVASKMEELYLLPKLVGASDIR